MSEGIIIKKDYEIPYIRNASKIAAQVLEYLSSYIKPGVSTLELDKIAEDFILSKGGKPAFKGYTISDGSYKLTYYHSICASVNEIVIHGVPSEKVILKEGDIISIDVGVIYNGYYGDTARTYFVGKVDAVKVKLSNVTREALYEAIKICRIGTKIEEISKTIYGYVKSHGFDVIRGYTGHGVGRFLHEAPPIPNYPSVRGPSLQKNMTIAIEPMVVSGTYKITVLPDKWSVCTLDGKPSAHWEHTILITNGEPEILSIPE